MNTPRFGSTCRSCGGQIVRLTLRALPVCRHCDLGECSGKGCQLCARTKRRYTGRAFK